MNSNTKQTLIDFINKVEVLAQGVMMIAGVECVTQLVNAAEHAKYAIEHDETIVEAR